MSAPKHARSNAELDHVGTVHRVTLTDTADRVVTADLVILDAVRLGCGCFRLYADRPGSRPGEDGYAGVSTKVEFLTGGCVLHADAREQAS
jgi:hypothetical protein